MPSSIINLQSSIRFDMERVVITGMGVCSPVGCTLEAFWDNVVQGRNGIGRITLSDPEQYSTQIAGEVWDFEPANYMEKRDVRRMERFVQFAMAAAKMAA